jgi:hypothetical protein
MRLKFGEAYAVLVRSGADKTCCECGTRIKQRQPYVRAKSHKQPTLAFCIECEPFNDNDV